MYKYLIVGVTVLLLGSAGYYFRTSSGTDMIEQAVAMNDGTNYAGATEVFSGPYRCTIGCPTTTIFVLHDDSTFEALTTSGDGERSPFATGSWGVGNGGALVFVIDPVTNGTTSPPFSFMAKKVSSYKLMKFSAKIKNFGLKDPTFTRISESDY